MGLLLANTIAYIALSIFIIIYLTKNAKSKKPIFPFLILTVLYLIMATIYSLWSLSVLQSNIADIISIYSIAILFQSIIIFQIIHSLNSSKKTIYFLLSYFPLTLSFLISPKYLILLSSAIFMLIISVYLSYLKIKNAGKIGTVYATLSLIFYSIVIIVPSVFIVFSTILNIFLILFITSLINNIDSKKTKQKKVKKDSYPLCFIKYFIFILVLVNFIFIATLSIHEVGHLATSKFYDCDSGRIIYESHMPITEIRCSDEVNHKFIILGGILLPIIISLLLFVSGGKFIKEIALIIFGFNLIFSFKDMIELMIPENIAVFIVLIGIAEVGIGIGLLAKARTEEDSVPSIIINQK
jgi:hypothetical protein